MSNQYCQNSSNPVITTAYPISKNRYNITLYGVSTVQDLFTQRTASQQLQSFLTHLNIGHSSPHTIRNARSILKRYLYLASSQEDINLLLKDYTSNFVAGFKAPAYRYTVIYYLRQFFDYLGFPKRDNPARLLKYPSVNPTSGRQYLTSNELHQIFIVLKEWNDRGKGIREMAMVKMLLFTGLRPSEILALKKQDLKEHSEGKVILIRNSKTHKSRVAFLPGTVERYLKEFHQTYSRPENPYVFYSLASKTSPLSYSAFIRAFNLVLQAAQINRSGLGLHSLRHTFARSLEESPIPFDIEVTQYLLGHANSATTRLYRSLNQSDIFRRAAAIESAVNLFMKGLS